MRLTQDTLQFLNRRLNRALTRGSRAVRYSIRIPQDKLDFIVGATLNDRYYVLSLLGKGGMSLVYKAKDMNTSEIVAVKCLRTQVLADQTIVKRFKREADVLKRLNHPRIVQFYAYGTSAGGLPFFIMDYLIGKSLGHILRVDGPLELGRFQDIFVQVAAAIGHAHKHGAIHRDLKPGNIMLVEKGDTSDYVKIVDFGIAKVTEGTQRLTKLGEVWGSPIYMSPEQCMGTNIDDRSDIYSLGIVMYEALTGEVPFLGRNYADTMTKQISEEPPPFKVVAPDKKIPESVEQIVFKAIKKKPQERYQNMADLKRDLERALDARSVEVKQSGRSFIKQPSGEYSAAIPTPATDALEATSEKLPMIPLERRLDVTSDKLIVTQGTSLTHGIAPGSPSTGDRKDDSDHPYFGKANELTGPKIIAASAVETDTSGSRAGEITPSNITPSQDSPYHSDVFTPGKANIAAPGGDTDSGGPRPGRNASEPPEERPRIRNSGIRASRGSSRTSLPARRRQEETAYSQSDGVKKKSSVSRSRLPQAARSSAQERHDSQEERTKYGVSSKKPISLNLIIGLLIISVIAGVILMSFINPVNIKEWLLNNVYVTNDEQH